MYKVDYFQKNTGRLKVDNQVLYRCFGDENQGLSVVKYLSVPGKTNLVSIVFSITLKELNIL